MKEFEKIESLLKTKAYGSLTVDEKAIVDAELGQDTYEELRNGLTQIASEQIKVRKDVKASLMTELKQKERSGIFALVQFKLPAYTHAFSLYVSLVPRPNLFRLRNGRTKTVARKRAWYILQG